MFFMYFNHTDFTKCSKKIETHVSVNFVDIAKRAPEKVKIKKKSLYTKDKPVLALKKKESVRDSDKNKKNIIKSKHHKFAFLKQVQIKNLYKKTRSKSLSSRRKHKLKQIKTVRKFKTLKSKKSVTLKEKEDVAVLKNLVKYAKPSQTNDRLIKNRENKFRVANISNRSYTNIFMWINKHKFYPTEALYKEDEGEIGLSFIINASGKIENIDVKKPSQYDVLNAAAKAIVKNSSPIPKRLLGKIGSFPLKAQINIVFKIE